MCSFLLVSSCVSSLLVIRGAVASMASCSHPVDNTCSSSDEDEAVEVSSGSDDALVEEASLVRSRKSDRTDSKVGDISHALEASIQRRNVEREEIQQVQDEKAEVQTAAGLSQSKGYRSVNVALQPN